MARSYKFAILKVTPDLRRGETVNVGIVYFEDGRPMVQLLPVLTKVQALDGTIDPALVFDLADRLPKLFEPGDKEADVIGRFNELSYISTSPLGEFVARNEFEVVEMVSELMRKFVQPPRRKQSSLRETRLSVDIKGRLRGRKLLGESLSDIDKHLVVPHFPISEQLDLYADFAVKNGVMHVVKTIDFRVKNAPSAEKFREACAVSFSNIKAQEEYKSLRRLVVYAADKSIESGIDRHLSILSDDADHVLNYESDADRQFFLAEIAKAATGQQHLHDKLH